MTNFALLQTNIAFCDPEANFKRVRELFAQAMAKDPRPDVVDVYKRQSGPGHSRSRSR